MSSEGIAAGGMAMCVFSLPLWKSEVGEEEDMSFCLCLCVVDDA